jgi:hypothetical protein
VLKIVEERSFVCKDFGGDQRGKGDVKEELDVEIFLLRRRRCPLKHCHFPLFIHQMVRQAMWVFGQLWLGWMV